MSDIAEIVARLEATLGPAEGAPVALTGGITNRNYRVRCAGRDYVVRIPGKDTDLLGIDRAAELVANTAAAELGIAPAVVAAFEDCIVTDYVECEQMTPSSLRAEPEPVARALRRFHDDGPALPVRFWVPDLLAGYARIVADRGGLLPPQLETAAQLAQRIAAAVPLTDPVPCHDDLLAGNIIRAPDRILLVDWEYAGMGARLFDLGNLSVNNDFDEDADARLLRAYFGSAPDARLHAALGLMRVMSDIREAAWGVVQGTLSELEFDFGGYAEQHFDRMLEAASRPAFEEWIDAAAA